MVAAGDAGYGAASTLPREGWGGGWGGGPPEGGEVGGGVQRGGRWSRWRWSCRHPSQRGVGWGMSSRAGGGGGGGGGGGSGGDSRDASWSLSNSGKPIERA